MRSRYLATAVAFLSILFGLVGALITPAGAAVRDIEPAKTGCTLAADGFVCIETEGVGTSVTEVQGSYRVPARVFVCDVKFRLIGTRPNGSAYRSEKAAGCGFMKVWVHWRSLGTFKAGSSLCVQPYVDGSWRAQKACIKITT